MSRRFIGLSILALGVCATAFADPAKLPDPSKCMVPAHIDVVGSNGAVPDPSGAFTVTIRDFANNPQQGTYVVIDFRDCSDIRVACDQLTPVTGQSIVAPGMVGATSGPGGQVTFYVQGSSDAQMFSERLTSPGTRAGTPCAAVYADGVLLRNVTVSANDVNGIGSPTAALNGADIALAASEMLKAMVGAEAKARDDFNGNGAVSGVDISILAGRRLAGATMNTGNVCP